ncbi:fibronectin type III-like domain-contianing protein [Pseudomonas corrugata]|jgi:beta-glucosidase|uniref:fibronectin type III-like domain-contianing protein n=1 Tax=Pseudomonas corrugata TaxID=47879 RepID=UPI0009C06FBF
MGFAPSFPCRWPRHRLRGFSKVKLAPGETETVGFTLDQDDFASLDTDFLPVVESGTFTVYVGGSSATDNQASFEVTSGASLNKQRSAIPRLLRETSLR